jgi:hypothetical protein
MNRQQRRAYQKSLPAYQKMSKEARINALVKNGITPDDLKKCREEGYQMGVESAVIQCYAALCLALNETFGFGRERVLRALKAVDEKVIFAIDSAEMCEEVFKRFGIRMDFKQGMDRVQEESA